MVCVVCCVLCVLCAVNSSDVIHPQARLQMPAKTAKAVVALVEKPNSSLRCLDVSGTYHFCSIRVGVRVLTSMIAHPSLQAIRLVPKRA